MTGDRLPCHLVKRGQVRRTHGDPHGGRHCAFIDDRAERHRRRRGIEADRHGAVGEQLLHAEGTAAGARLSFEVAQSLPSAAPPKARLGVVGDRVGRQGMVGVQEPRARIGVGRDAGRPGLDARQTRRAGKAVVLPGGVGNLAEKLHGGGRRPALQDAPDGEGHRQARGRRRQYVEVVHHHGQPFRVAAGESNHPGAGEHQHVRIAVAVHSEHRLRAVMESVDVHRLREEWWPVMRGEAGHGASWQEAAPAGARPGPLLIQQVAGIDPLPGLAGAAGDALDLGEQLGCPAPDRRQEIRAVDELRDIRVGINTVRGGDDLRPPRQTIGDRFAQRLVVVFASLPRRTRTGDDVHARDRCLGDAHGCPPAVVRRLGTACFAQAQRARDRPFRASVLVSRSRPNWLRRPGTGPYPFSLVSRPGWAPRRRGVGPWGPSWAWCAGATGCGPVGATRASP